MTFLWPFIRLLSGVGRSLVGKNFRLSFGEWCRLAGLASKPPDFEDRRFHVLDEMRHAAAALRALAAAPENLARRHYAKYIELHQAADSLLDVARGDDIALTDDHRLLTPLMLRWPRSGPRSIR
jgi:hypothetical protein